MNKKCRSTPSTFESLESRQLLSAVKIMPLGDSITSSFGGHASYRFFLYSQLVQAGYDVDFVGTQTLNNGGTPLYSNFDTGNEGHSGWRADQITANIAAWAAATQPDIVLLHAGSNDIEQGQSNSSTITDISGTIDNLRSVLPNVKILLAQIIPETTNTAQFPALNSMIATLASQKNTAQSPVILVDQYTGFNASSDTFDGVHPNDSGERKMSAKWFNALTSVLPAPNPQNVVYLSNLTPTSQSNGWGPFENDRSNGETGANDGNTLSVGGMGFLKGIGAHASSDITYNISGGSYTSFNATLGVDDEKGNAGSVVFQVYVNGVLQYTSPKLTGSSAALPISVPLSGASTLRLVVTDSGDGNANDHADWADAKLIVGQIIPPPIAPTGLDATYNSTTGKIDLLWSDNASDETGYRIERKAGSGGTYAQIADPGADSKTFSDNTGLSAGTTYYYRVYAYKTGAANSGYSNEDNALFPTQPGTYYLSDLNFTVNANGWGQPERDRSNGEQGSSDGHTITLNGQTYTKGIGVHGLSDLTFNLGGQYTQFLSDIGVDDEVGNNGSVNFQVYFNGSSTAAYDSGKMTGSSATKQITLDVTGVQTLRLVVTNGGDGADFDHADWANARIIAGEPVTPPTAPDGLSATYNSTTNAIDLSWNDNASDEVGYRVERKAGSGGTYAQVADLVAGSTTFSDSTNLSPGTTYYYRVYAYKVGANSGYSEEAHALDPVASGTTTYLSDMQFTVNANGWGQPERDRSNGEQGSSDGHTITLNGQTYTKGIGVHAASTLTFALNGQYSQFFSDVGIDDEVGNNGSVNFQVYLDGVLKYDSGKLGGASAITQVALNVAGAQQLRLVVTNGGDNIDFDHADWANARLIT
ncbi:MAG TPA: NPCBM/NEW2 domain-containing protein [Tepidisphaeraceae bacterium]|nr:NPCBM/NEW2 domain-containing protein [Tepidisphaeraceae bacterium]